MIANDLWFWIRLHQRGMRTFPLFRISISRMRFAKIHSCSHTLAIFYHFSLISRCKKREAKNELKRIIWPGIASDERTDTIFLYFCADLLCSVHCALRSACEFGLWINFVFCIELVLVVPYFVLSWSRFIFVCNSFIYFFLLPWNSTFFTPKFAIRYD